MTQRALLAAAMLVIGAPPAAAQHVGRCQDGMGFQVSVSGFRAPTGFIKVYLYGDDPAAFLESGRSMSRIEIPVRSRAPIDLCLPVPRPGRYAVSVRHDVDGNRQRIDWSDGGGFSNNPSLTLLRLRPALRAVLVDARTPPADVRIILNYRFGFDIRPVRR